MYNMLIYYERQERRLDQSHLMPKIFKDGKRLPNQLRDCLLLKIFKGYG
jgi:hypothetical protein